MTAGTRKGKTVCEGLKDSQATRKHLWRISAASSNGAQVAISHLVKDFGESCDDAPANVETSFEVPTQAELQQLREPSKPLLSPARGVVS